MAARLPMPIWLIYTLLTMFLWGGWGVASKLLSGIMTAWQVQCLSTLGIVPVILFLAIKPGVLSGIFGTRGFWLAALSGITTSLGNVAYFKALAAGGKAAEVTPLTSLYPLMTIAISVVFLKERMNRFQVLGICGSMVSLYIMNTGGRESFMTPWVVLALVPIFLWGITGFLQKLATLDVTADKATLGFLLGFIPAAIAIPFFETIPLNWPQAQWGELVALGFLFGLGNLTLIYAYCSGGKASIVTPMGSLYSVVTIPLAMWLLKESIDARGCLGIMVTLVSVAALSYETKHPDTAEK